MMKVEKRWSLDNKKLRKIGPSRITSRERLVADRTVMKFYTGPHTTKH